MGERRTDYVHAEDARIRTVKDELEHAIGRKHAPAQAAVVRGHPNLGVVARGDGLLLRQPVVADLWDRPDPHGERPRRLVRRAQRRRRRRTRGPLEHRVDSALCLARAGCTRGMHAREIIRSARHAPRAFNTSTVHLSHLVNARRGERRALGAVARGVDARLAGLEVGTDGDVPALSELYARRLEPKPCAYRPRLAAKAREVQIRREWRERLACHGH